MADEISDFHLLIFLHDNFFVVKGTLTPKKKKNQSSRKIEYGFFFPPFFVIYNLNAELHTTDMLTQPEPSVSTQCRHEWFPILQKYEAK